MQWLKLPVIRWIRVVRGNILGLFHVLEKKRLVFPFTMLAAGIFVDVLYEAEEFPLYFYFSLKVFLITGY